MPKRFSYLIAASLAAFVLASGASLAATPQTLAHCQIKPQQQISPRVLAQFTCQGVPYCGSRAPVCVQYGSSGCCVRWHCAF
jgi:hypothetical protein